MLGTVTADANGNWSFTVGGAGTATGAPTTLSDGGHSLTATATDAAGNRGTSAPVTFTVDTAGPVTTDATASPNPVETGKSLTITARVSDAQTGGSWITSAAYSLNGSTYAPMSAGPGFDNVTEDVTVTISTGLTTGVYNVCVRGTDAAGNIGGPLCFLLAVYDSAGGFVTGGGWINSPGGACQRADICKDAVGRANFGFVSKYQRGATVPTGQTQFQFQAGNLNFHSSAYEWLVVSGHRAQYQGSGTINGTGNYGFKLTAVDNGNTGDQFRIQIWLKNTDGSRGPTVYDNQPGASEPDVNTGANSGTVIAGGNIDIKR